MTNFCRVCGMGPIPKTRFVCQKIRCESEWAARWDATHGKPESVRSEPL